MAASPLMAIAARRLFAPDRLIGAADRLADGLGVHDGLFVDGVVRSRLRGVRLNPVLSTPHAKFYELDR